MPEPAVSVVVATRNRPLRLARLLSALRTQDVAADAFELIVVDDGSDPATAALLADRQAPGVVGLRTVRNETPRGPAAARNLGWSLARAPLVALTDDDCVPVPGWLSAGLDAHRSSPESIVQGPTEPDPAERSNVSVFSHTVRRTRLGPSYETCNIFYPRSVLERMGGFDERFGRYSAGEDTDLAWRALDAGVTAVFAPDALVRHAVERLGPRATLRRARRWTPCVRVLAEHPPARVMLERGIFWNVWHYLLLRSALALLGPRWVRRLVLSRHLLALRARARDAGEGAWSVPFLLVYDAVETAAIVRGAVRYRTLVL